MGGKYQQWDWRDNKGGKNGKEREGPKDIKESAAVGPAKKKGLTQPFRSGLNGTISGDDGVIVDEFPVRGLEVDAESVVHPESLTSCFSCRGSSLWPVSIYSILILRSLVRSLHSVYYGFAH